MFVQGSKRINNLLLGLLTFKEKEQGNVLSLVNKKQFAMLAPFSLCLKFEQFIRLRACI